MNTLLVLPSLKIGGGTREAIRLVIDLQTDQAVVLSMWESPHPIKCPIPVAQLSSWAPNIYKAPFHLAAMMFLFARWRHIFMNKSGRNATNYIFTHYSTIPLAFLVPKTTRYFFVQGVEWQFTSNKIVSAILKRIIVAAYRSGRIISANRFLTNQMQQEGLTVTAEMPIWSEAIFRTKSLANRDIDYVMVLRKGEVKRLDLYRHFVALAVLKNRRIAVITTEDDLALEFSSIVSEILLRPTADAMREIYMRSHCFIHLSDHEGFGLPPLESMGSGCVPICRDSGGIRAFLYSNTLSKLIHPKTMPPTEFFEKAEKLLTDKNLLAEYSKEVLQIFADGLVASNNARLNLSNLLNQSSR